MQLRLNPIAAAAALCSATLAPATATAQPAVLDTVVVSPERTGQTTFDAPAAIGAVTRTAIEEGGLQVNLSESLARLPGITVLNRQNYAQDLQLSIRGFGARSTFGIRGVRLIVDGIPASMPDGQGQASNVALSSAGRIEVLRGPLAQLYGNAAGGVVQVFTDLAGGIDGEGSAMQASLGAGSYGQVKAGVRYNHVGPRDAMVIDASRFRTDGYRDHSRAERGQLNAKWQGQLGSDTQMSVVFNALDQPDSLDPLGLTRAQFEANPRQAVALARTQRSSKTVFQTQIGTVAEHRLDDRTGISARLYAGERQLRNALSIPPAAQQAPTSAGGIVDFARSYAGIGVQLNHRLPLGEGRALRLVVGLDHDRLLEDRQGYVNVGGGVQGDLKRDEQNTVRTLDFFGQGALDLTPAWALTAGVRTSSVRFRTADRFIRPGNPDDSGGVDYSATNPVLGLTWRATPSLNLYANVGRGFETPTFTELAYRPGATGLNTALRAARSRHAEVGAKWRAAPGQRVDVAAFDIATRDDIVVDTNAGGRSTFKNAARTSRQGVELAHSGQWAGDLSSTVAVTWLQARFDDRFVSGSGASAVTVPAGARLPGLPEKSGFAELAWRPAVAWGGFNASIQVQGIGSIAVNDANTDAAPGVWLLNARAGFAQSAGPWRFTQGLRLDNATDERYAGSVIVNEANQRFFEPAMPRHWSLLATAQYQWR
ncbi:MAG: TonB-dependent receptor [Ideonella sp.]|nr:TonB-dependent receptor [Ideonella sp.]